MFYHLGTLIRKTCIFCQKCSMGIRKTTIHVSTGRFRKSSFHMDKKVFEPFSDIELKTLGQPAKKSRLPSKIWLRVDKTAFYVSIETFWEFFWKFVFLSVWEIERKSCGFGGKLTLFGRSSILRAYRKNLMEKFSFEKITSLKFSGIWANTYRPSMDNFSADGQDYLLLGQRKLLRRNNFFEQRLFLLFFHGPWEKTFERENIGRDVKNSILRFPRKILRGLVVFEKKMFCCYAFRKFCEHFRPSDT